MADEIENDGPGASLSHMSRNDTIGSKPSHASGSTRIIQPGLDRHNGVPSTTTATGVQQPKPQALPKRSGPASIIVSPRQKGNPVLDKIKSMPWEYGDILADYVLGATTCALFLSLKYHRLHPEYIYTRIKNLQHKIVLCMVDIQNHEESLKELSKTSVINNVTIILCWSAAEGARYLELYKTFENAAPTSIKQHQSTTYSDRMIDFITTPRAVNKTDAVSIVSQFGTIRTAVNARHEEVAMIAGWGEKKVQQWCNSVREPFRIQRAAKRGLDMSALVGSQPGSRAPTLSRNVTRDQDGAPAEASGPSRPATAASNADADQRPAARIAEQVHTNGDDVGEEGALADALTAAQVPAKRSAAQSSNTEPSEESSEEPKRRKQNDDPLSDGVLAALSKLRKAG
ncbi:hypothetical protein AC578_7946 [Pseudocercospora eumusae]|uniref:ERCC1-like central domain-containing protein n=1 Tax=Pseudocercospora eumusae TaxID=321146 RepID=A0A139HPE3_9PEZI|nr:hypothetical protein AC578_7946 [Pseudocercospora eumusae]